MPKKKFHPRLLVVAKHIPPHGAAHPVAFINRRNSLGDDSAVPPSFPHLTKIIPGRISKHTGAVSIKFEFAF